MKRSMQRIASTFLADSSGCSLDLDRASAAMLATGRYVSGALGGRS